MSNPLALESLGRAMARLPAGRLAAVRQQAFEHLRQNGVPTTRREDWKYTDLRPIVDISNAWLEQLPAAPVGVAAAADPAVLTGLDGVHWIVIADGVVDTDSVAAARSAGLDVSLLSESDAALDWDAPLADLNAALLVDGLHIRVGRDACPERPIGLLLVDNATRALGVAQARVEIEVEAGARADFIEFHSSSGGFDHYANSVVTLALGAGAATNYVRLQLRGRAHAQTGRLTAVLERDSTFRHAAYDLGGGLVRNDLAIDIRGRGADAGFSGVYLASDGQHVDNHTRVDHRKGPARSEQEYRGIAAGSGRAVWNGKAIVHAGADGTDATQANHNLLLSERAEIDAKPELEIYADDVKCSHGTTIGQLDQGALYYLRSRGITRRDAERLLTRAFARSVVAKNPVHALGERLEELLDARLGELLGEAGT